MNQREVLSFLESFFAALEKGPPEKTEVKPFLDLVLSLRRDLPLSIPLLRALAALNREKEAAPAFRAPGTAFLLQSRIDRRYRRLCRVQEELGRLDFKKAAPGLSPEDYVFSRIDFARYREIAEKDFDFFYREGPADFSAEFHQKNFRLDKERVLFLIEGSYEKSNGVYRLKKESPLILSIMRSLETSLETLPLFTPDEIEGEIGNLVGFLSESGNSGTVLPGREKLFPRLLSCLDKALMLHEDGMRTELFLAESGDLFGKFRPGNKPWTMVLVPAGL